MKRRIPIMLLIVSLFGIGMRSGAVGMIYRQVTGNPTGFSLDVPRRCDPGSNEATFGGFFPTLKVNGVGDKTVTVFSESGRAGNVTLYKNGTYYNSSYFKNIYAVAKGQGDSEFWWSLNAGNSYAIYVKTSRFGIVLDQKKIILTQHPLYGYYSKVEDGWSPMDIPLFFCVAAFLTGVFLLALGRKQKKQATKTIYYN